MTRSILIDLAIMTVIGVVLALIGPFGSFQDPLAIRLMIWVGFAWVGYALYAPIDTLAQRLAPTLDLPAWGLRAVACVIASVPMAIVVWILPQMPGPVIRPGIERAFEHYLYVLMVGALITVVNTLVNRSRGAPADSALAPARDQPDVIKETDAARSDTPRFLDRLPAELGTELIALEMEDHYVRVHTSLGSDLLLMRMRDAVAEIDGIDGIQVHRSWWVARGAVEDVQREGRNVRLVLSGGLEAPVSRANVQPLRDAGWI